MTTLFRQCAMTLSALAITFSVHAKTDIATEAPDTNEAPSLMVRFAPSPSKGYTAEEVLEQLENDKAKAEPWTKALYARLGNPKSVRYLISTRLAPEYRRYLKEDDPAELLHHWLVVEYDDLEHSHASKIAMKRDPLFLHVAQDYYLEFSATVPNDPYYNSSFVIPGTGVPGIPSIWGTRQKNRYSQLNIPNAWDLVTGTAYVAVADHGIQKSHPDLRDNLREHFSKNIKDQNNLIEEDGPARGHGTHVSGLVAAKGNNSKGTSGVCWNCSLISFKVVSETPMPILESRLTMLTDAINEAVNTGVQAINISMGEAFYNEPPPSMVKCGTNLETQPFCNAIDYATSKQVSVIASAGNHGNKINPYTQFPANYSPVLSIGAIDSNNNRLSFSSTGKVDFMAPGDMIYSTF